MPVVERRFDAVLFDLDGVLVDTVPWWGEVRVRFAAAHGRAWTADDQAAVMGGNSLEWAAIMQERLDLPDLPLEAILNEVVAGVVACYRDAVKLPVIGDAPTHVRRIAAEVPVAIASSSHRALIDAAVDAMGLRGVLSAIVSSDEVPRGKPDPGVYLLAASRLGVDPARCLVVEDSVNGVRAGKSAGMVVALVPSASGPPEEDAKDLADVVVAALADLDPERMA